jgi:hypothetical protein
VIRNGVRTGQEPPAPPTRLVWPGSKLYPPVSPPIKSNGHGQIPAPVRLCVRQVIWRHNCFLTSVGLHFCYFVYRAGTDVPSTTTGRKDCEPKPNCGVLEVTPLRGETKERWRELCERAVVEQDPDRFLTTIQELLQVLEEREQIAGQRDRVRVPPNEKPYIMYPVR